MRGSRCAAALASLLLAACGSDAIPPTAPPGPGPPRLMARGPYLQHADGGITVVWYTDAPGEGRVRFFSEDGVSSGEALAPAGTTRREATLRDLRPGIRYVYRVYHATGPLAAPTGELEFSFRTAGAGVLRFVVFGDSGNGSAEQLAVARAIAAEPVLPDLVVIVGDVIYPPADASSWDPFFFTPYRALLPSVRFYAVPGNHDYEIEGGRTFFDALTLPRNGPSAFAPESSWWLEHAGVLLIAHDTNQSVSLLRQHAVPWHVELARRPADFRIVFQHHALYSSGSGFAEPPASQLRELLAPLFDATGVDLVFNGHDHFYERTRPIDGVVYVTTGAGGAPLYARTATNGFTDAFANDRHGYTYVEVSGRTLSLRQMDTEGRAYDALTLTKPDPAAGGAAAPR